MSSWLSWFVGVIATGSILAIFRCCDLLTSGGKECSRRKILGADAMLFEIKAGFLVIPLKL
ncbi:MAG: hypothetical protein QNJ47_25095 [Nostocaceae cyanobacterium]|nr:hypothetical protein [Nostocaceae cyanobacterium]